MFGKNQLTDLPNNIWHDEKTIDESKGHWYDSLNPPPKTSHPPVELTVNLCFNLNDETPN